MIECAVYSYQRVDKVAIFDMVCRSEDPAKLVEPSTSRTSAAGITVHASLAFAVARPIDAQS
jgi:hypothetical protein